MQPEKLSAGYYSLTEKEKIAVAANIADYLGRQPQIVFAFLYGSFLTEKFFRDIDIGIFVMTIDPKEFLGFENRLAVALEQEFNFLLPIEVKVINTAPLSFCFQVVRGSLLFFRDEERLTDFMEATARKYLDMAPLRQHYLREAMT